MIISHNDASRIEAHIERLWFVDEIVLIDLNSVDETVGLASKNAKTHIISYPINDVLTPNEVGISKAKNDWIFLTDFNEDIPVALSKEISNLASITPSVAYSIKREHYFMGKHLKHSGFKKDYALRLFNRNHIKCDAKGNPILLDTASKTEALTSALLYKPFTSFDAFTTKLHQESAQKAQQRYKKKEQTKRSHFFIRPFFRFWKQYLGQLGILDGKEGFILAYLYAFAEFKTHLNLWLLYRKID